MTVLTDDRLAAAIAGVGRPRSPFDYRRRNAYAMMQAGTDSSPVLHPLQGAARLANALIGGWTASQADADERAADQKEISALGEQLAGTPHESLARTIAGLKPETARPILTAALSQKIAGDAAKRDAETFVASWQGPTPNTGAGRATDVTGRPAFGASASPGGYQATLGGYESGNDPNAVNPQSGAHGEFQFLAQAAEDVRRARPDLNLPPDFRQWTQDQQRAAEPIFRQLNAQRLQQAGIAPTPANLYLAHRAGASGAQTILQAPQDTPLSLLVPPTWLQQNPDMRTTAGQFVQLAQQRFGGPAPGGPQGGPQIVQGDSTPQYVTGDGAPPRPLPPQAAGPAMTGPPDVPMPQPSREMLTRYGQLVGAGQMTSAQANTAMRGELTQEWQLRRQQSFENWRLQNQNAREERRDAATADRDAMKREADLRKDVQVRVIGDRVNEFEKNMRPRAQAAHDEILKTHQARQLLDAGAFTGPGANVATSLGRIGEFFGIDATTATNTQALQTVLAERVLSAIKTLGANPSNADRDFIEKARGGQITFSEQALRRILDIGERMSRNVIQQHDSEAGRLRKLPGIDGLPGDFYGIGNVPTYQEWLKDNPATAPQAQPNGYAPHPNPNAPTNMPAPASLPTVNSPEEARRLPSGTQFRTPDGRVKVVP